MRHPTIGEIEALARFESELASLRATHQATDPVTAAQPASELAVPSWLAASDEGGEDWDLLLGAIKARLRVAAGHTPGHRPNGSAGSGGTLILECVDALDLLQLMLRQRLARGPLAVPAVSARATTAGPAAPQTSSPRPPATAPSGAARSQGWTTRFANGSTR
jgi:hypothetical protein